MNTKSMDGTRLILSADLGGSKIKAIAQLYPSGVPCVLSMDPEIADVSKSSIAHLSKLDEHHSTTWIGIGDEYFVFGAVAKSSFAGTAALRNSKYHYALPKIAALVSKAYHQYGIDHPNVEVFIQMLLPPGEVNDGRQLAEKLKLTFKQGILTSAGRLKGKLRRFDVASEGSGILSYRSRFLGRTYAQKNVGMLMLGYRNASFVLSQKGTSTLSETTNLGMSWLINSFVERTAVGLSKEDSRLVSAILAAGGGKMDALRPLSRQNTPAGVQSDLELFHKILPSVREDYCRALIRWIRNIAMLDEILLCGGTADFIRKELTEYFQLERIPIVWNGEVEIPQPLNTQGLGDRVADVWTAHITYIKMLDKNFGYERKQELVPDPTKSSQRHSTPSHEEWLKRGYLPMRSGI